MARHCTAANTQRIEADTAAVTAVPLTLACWFMAMDTTTEHCLVFVGDKGSSNNYFFLAASGNAGGDPIRAYTRDAVSNVVAASTAAYTANVWQHAAAVYAATNSRVAYLNGGNSGTETTIAVPVGPNRTSIGRVGRNVPFAYLDGLVAEVGIWNVALSASEIAALAQRVSPLHVQAANLVGYWPLYGVADPEPDYSGAVLNLTLAGGTGTPAQADHAPVQPPLAGSNFGWLDIAGGRIFKLAGEGGGLAGPMRGLAAAQVR